MLDGAFGTAVLEELPEEKILDLSVLASDCSNELLPYAEDWLPVEYDEWYNLGSYVL